ncbi:MAG: addiction module protein [Planctomycetaceae bacterium]|jgi:putative addiction module component (TIGR02574 family)|nr:addiction module protein [Planctomycetaceae bacterium]
MSEFDTVYSAASQLPVADRLRLIDALAAMVPDDHPPTLPEVWLSEIERRCAEVDTGAVTTEPWEDVRSRLFENHGLSDAD